MTMLVKHLYEFRPFCLDATERELRRNGQKIVLRPKLFEVLLLLIENYGHIVEKEVILQKVWPNCFVEESNITVSISVLKKVLSEGGNDRRYIETIPKRGYRFTSTVKEIVEEDGSLTSTRNAVPVYSEALPSTYSDADRADNKGQ